jgi:DNA topoisomerase VI subunit B
MTKLQRTTFAASRAAEYFDARQLSTLTGTPTSDFANVVLKELVDNSLDACEVGEAGVAPEIAVTVDTEPLEGEVVGNAIRIMVADNGPGIPSEVVRRLLDYEVRVSDKAAYRSPTRGAQGNALKTVIGIPYALGSREPITIVAGDGIEHTIEPSVDPAGNVHIGHDERNGHPRGGTTVSVLIPTGLDGDAATLAEINGFSNPLIAQHFHPGHWVGSFAAFNPHATISYKVTGTVWKGPKFTNRLRTRSRSMSPRNPPAHIGTALSR